MILIWKKENHLLKTMLKLFRKILVILFPDDYNLKISYIKIIEDVLEIHRNINGVSYSVTSIDKRYLG